MPAYVQSISLHQYGATSKPSGSISIVNNEPYMTSSLNLTDEEAVQLQTFAASIFDRRKKEFAKEILAAEPMPLLAAPPSSSVVDAEFTTVPDDMPF